MKVLFVDQLGKTAGRDTLGLAELMNDDDFQMTVYLSDNTEIPKNKEYSVRIQKGFHRTYEGNIFNKVTNYLKALHELKKIIKADKFDIVHLQWFSIPWVEWIFVKSLTKYTRVVITVHDVIPFDKRPLEMRFLDRIYDSADWLLLHTDKAKEEFLKNYKAKTPVSVITQSFCYKPDYVRADKSKAREKLQIPLDAVVFLYYGTIRPSKGLDTLLKAIREAKKEEKNIFLLAAGAFHKVDEEYYRTLAKSIVEAGSKVDFGFLPYEMEKYYFSAADVLVLPYTEGTQSGVAQLGLMYELPLIASDIYCMDGVAKEGVNALRFNAKDVNGLKKCICELARDIDERHEFAKASKDMGETEFALDNKARLVKEAYSNALGLRA